MSFVFPEPPSPPKRYYNLSEVNPLNYAELLVRLSIFAFSKLSVSDQQDKMEEIREKAVEDVIVEQLPEENGEGFRLRMFTELFKKLPIPEQNLFLSSVIKIFKHARRLDELHSWFKHLGARDQQDMIECIVPAVAPKNMMIPRETMGDFRLRRFTQLSEVYTDYVYHKYLVTWGPYNRRLQKLKVYDEGGISERSDEDSSEASGDDEDEYSDKEEATYEDKKEFSDQDKEGAPSDEDGVVKMSRFGDFFVGFSTVWFEGQNRGYQRLLIEQLCDGVKGVMIKKLEKESKDEFKLRRFKELCKKVVDFAIQERFLHSAEKIILQGTSGSLPHGKLLQPQDSAGAAELCMHISSFGFSLLPTVDQQQKVKKISQFAHQKGVKTIKRLANESTEEFRIRKFKELSPTSMHLSMFKEFTEKFFSQRQFHESIFVFRQLSSKDQQDLIENLFEKLTKKSGYSETMNEDDDDFVDGVEVQDIIVEKSADESEEHFRLRRFIALSTKHPYLCKNLGPTENGKYDRKGTLHSSANEEIQEIKDCRYSEFYLGSSIIWFKTRCASMQRNPIQVLFGKIEADNLFEKLPDESEEDFRLRRFTETFQQLPFRFQEKLLKYILKTVSYDIGEEAFHYRKYGKPSLHGHGSSRMRQEYTPQTFSPQGTGSLYPEFIKFVSSPEMVEAIAGRLACELVVQYRLSPVMFESDCLKVVNASKDSEVDGSNLGVRGDGGCQTYHLSCFVHVVMEANIVAHKGCSSCSP